MTKHDTQTIKHQTSLQVIQQLLLAYAVAHQMPCSPATIESSAAAAAPPAVVHRRFFLFALGLVPIFLALSSSASTESAGREALG
jgi:hypothetical protein